MMTLYPHREFNEPMFTPEESQCIQNWWYLVLYTHLIGMGTRPQKILRGAKKKQKKNCTTEFQPKNKKYLFDPSINLIIILKAFISLPYSQLFPNNISCLLLESITPQYSSQHQQFHDNIKNEKHSPKKIKTSQRLLPDLLDNGAV